MRPTDFTENGIVQHTIKVINDRLNPQAVSVDPYLDALSVRFTYYPFSIRVK